MYKCEYCNTEYKTPVERAECEMKCNKKRIEAEAEAKKQVLIAEREAERREIDCLLDEFEAARGAINDKIVAYNKKYGIPYRTDRVVTGLFDLFDLCGGIRW